MEKVLDIQKAKIDNTIMGNYRNPHLLRNNVQENEVIVFGNPERSIILEIPLVVNRELLGELSIDYNQSPNHTEFQALTLKLRWKKLNGSQLKKLLEKINPLYNESYQNIEKEFDSLKGLEITEKESIIKARIGQSIFKKELLFKEKKCRLCGVSDERFLIASHIKPWSTAVYDDKGIVGLNSIHSIQIKQNNEVSLKFLLGILNSKLLNWIFRHENFHMVGKPLAEVKVIYLERLPIMIPNDEKPFVKLVDSLLEKNQAAYEVTRKFLEYISSIYKPKKMSNKLYLFDELLYDEFVKELNKQKVKLNDSQKFDLMDLFENQKRNLIKTKQEITELENQLDTMVCKLYKLSDKEIDLIDANK